MLTSEALEHRIWRDFPELREALKNRSVPDHYYGPISDSGNLFSSLAGLARVLVIAKEYRAMIEQSATLTNCERMAEDLRRLEGAAKWGESFFKDQAELCRQLAGEVMKQFSMVLSVPAGISYELILKHRMYSCPDSYSYRTVRLLAPRTPEGSIEKVFTIRKVLSLDPLRMSEAEMAEDERGKIAAYIAEARPTGILNDLGIFRFYMLNDDPAELPKPFCPPERMEGAHYLNREALIARQRKLEEKVN